MTFPSVTVNAVNLNQGPFPTVEKYFLFIGEGGTNQNTVLYLNTDSDLDAELGAADSELKRQVEAAKLNAGQNWACVAMPLADGTLWDAAIDLAMNEDIRVEGIFICTPVTTQAELTALQAKAIEIKASYGRELFVIATARGIDAATETWAAYIADINDLTDSLAADLVGVVPYIYDDAAGIYAGRLANDSVSVADSPMRTNTGALVGVDQSTLPVDVNGVRYNNAHAKALHDQRFSVPMYYPDYEGMYWSDGLMLDVTGGDYTAIENRRVQQKGARAVRIVLIGLVAERRINSSSIGEEWAVEKLMRPLREMSKEVVFQGIPFPAEIKPPKPGNVVLQWETREKVNVYISMQPYNIAKTLTANILLDLSGADE
jgi:hypothetical protein